MPVDAIEVIEPGLFTTVQDLGRYGYQRYGVPVSGAMDQYALRIGNLLVGNEPGAAGLEMTLAGPRLFFLADTVVAITGGDLRPRLDGALVPAWQPVPVARGMTLAFRGARQGSRAYLLVAGGIDTPLVLGSRSTFVRSRLGGFHGRPLQPGDRLGVPGLPVEVAARPMWRPRVPVYGPSARLRVIRGPHDAAFAPASWRTFVSSRYRVSSQSDRMGYRLEGPRLSHAESADIISEGTPPGAVQITGDGLPIVLLADRGTAGGYTKIATVIAADLGRIAQLAPADHVRFDEVSEAEAVAVLRQQEALVDQVASSPRHRYRRCLFSTSAGGLAVEALGPFEAHAEPGSGQPAERMDVRHVFVDGNAYRVTIRAATRIPPPGAPLAGADDGLTGAAAAVAATCVLRALEPGRDLALAPERPPLGPELEEVNVEVLTPRGTLLAGVALPTGCPVRVRVGGRSVTVSPDHQAGARHPPTARHQPPVHSPGAADSDTT